jgi:predicted nicotinamide N-methyase
MQPFAMNSQDTPTKPMNSESSRLLKTLQKRLNETLPGYELVPTHPPLCPTLRLALLEENLPTEPLPEHLSQKVMAEPAYWAFCWASGQVLAAHILGNPQIVAGKTALLACQTNAALNGVEIALIDDLQQAPSPLDLVIAADVLYDRDNFLFLDALPKAASAVLIADSRIKNFQHPGYTLLTQQTATTWPDLEEYPEYNHVRVYGSR